MKKPWPDADALHLRPDGGVTLRKGKVQMDLEASEAQALIELLALSLPAGAVRDFARMARLVRLAHARSVQASEHAAKAANETLMLLEKALDLEEVSIRPGRPPLALPTSDKDLREAEDAGRETRSRAG